MHSGPKGQRPGKQAPVVIHLGLGRLLAPTCTPHLAHWAACTECHFAAARLFSRLLKIDLNTLHTNVLFNKFVFRTSKYNIFYFKLIKENSFYQ